MEQDELFKDATKLILQHNIASTSLFQRYLSLGYHRASKIMRQLEEAKIIGKWDGIKPPAILIKNESELKTLIDNL